MATVDEGFELIDRYNQVLNRTYVGIKRIVIIHELMRRQLERPVTIQIDPAPALQEAPRALARINQELSKMNVKLNIELPSSLNEMFANTQRLISRLLVAVRQLGRTSKGSAESILTQTPTVGQFANNVGQQQEGQEQKQNDTGEKEASSEGLLGNLKSITSEIFSISSLQKAVDFVKWSDEIARVNARLGMVNDGTQTQFALQQKVMDVANGSRQSYADTATMITQLGSSNPGTFKSNQELLDFTSRYNKLLVASGTSPEESQSSMTAMTQAMTSGGLQSDGLQSLTESAPLLTKVLADGLGVARGSLEQLASDGKMTSEKIVKAFAQQDAYINAMFTKMPVTFSQAMTIGKNKAIEWVSSLNGANGPLQKVTDSVMKLVEWLGSSQGQGFFDGLTAGIRFVSDAFAAGVQFILDNMNIVRNVLMAVGIVVLGLAGYWLIMWAAASWPILAVIGVIALLIGVLNSFGVSTQQIVGAVMGFFNALFSFLWNGVALIWNGFLSFAEFLVNLFIDPVYTINKLFYDLAMFFMGHLYNMLRGTENFAGGFMKVILEGINGAIGGVNMLLKAISKIPGMGNIKPVNLLNTNNVHALSDGLKTMMGSLEAPTTDKDLWDSSKYRMEEKDIQDAYQTGDKYGQGLFGKTSNALDSIKQPGDAWSTANTTANIDRVNEVGKINDKVDIGSEDLKMMRELAELKNIQNFVTLQPQTTVNVRTGNVTKEADVDSLISRLSEHLEVAIVSSAEGVYV
ncbi:tape measure protein [Cohnella thailandensis]|uniref:Tape measure protein n=1 Tax=Cohnella thailandensis TaxID=557557 RepID=A0A841SQU1_9BACL|nr:tape measure protein [Cohnella thailandensis]MBB6633562.1 tape measure protein [Cohnella thailandensis]MBP1974580.1 tape measure domain-containing protein [Cohnella thailandensis]